MIKKTRPLINSGNLDLTLTSNPGYLHPKHKPDRNGITRAQRIHGELRAVSEIPNAHAPCFQAIYKLRALMNTKVTFHISRQLIGESLLRLRADTKTEKAETDGGS